MKNYLKTLRLYQVLSKGIFRGDTVISPGGVKYTVESINQAGVAVIINMLGECLAANFNKSKFTKLRNESFRKFIDKWYANINERLKFFTTNGNKI